MAHDLASPNKEVAPQIGSFTKLFGSLSIDGSGKTNTSHQGQEASRNIIALDVKIMYGLLFISIQCIPPTISKRENNDNHWQSVGSYGYLIRQKLPLPLTKPHRCPGCPVPIPLHLRLKLQGLRLALTEWLDAWSPLNLVTSSPASFFTKKIQWKKPWIGCGLGAQHVPATWFASA